MCRLLSSIYTGHCEKAVGIMVVGADRFAPASIKQIPMSLSTFGRVQG